MDSEFIKGFYKDLYIEIIIQILSDENTKKSKNIIKLLKSKDSTIINIGIELYKEYIK
jgi:hypothetical protein